ncbi:hypothetical protein MAPG_05230 [Magnaporthiopsis poae ATCC 64411]|uniref:Protein HGH1 homolog n=1 Tax=Magnaporthiopsis poae (strain ATCC 64411 / 73-15) TaxID=644358 RepID=A0A0C4DYV1_MAGP6|nr:hypothetical protein MAPG_05230 [Magnaporthiopsis poae ATCC 64411]
MPTELEELVGFVAHPNPQIRQVAVEHLVPYSTADVAIFKSEQLTPIKNLKILIRDHPRIAVHAIHILVNLSADEEILKNLAADRKFTDTVFERIVNPSEENANLLAMLLANLAKSDALKDILSRKQSAPEPLGPNDQVINQLMDLFVKGADGTYNKHANYDYLAYLFADLAKHDDVRKYLVEKQSYDSVVPLSKLRVFTEHPSDVRRRGVANTIKNVAFDVPSHPTLLAQDEVNILSYVLLPIMGNEDYDEDEMLEMLPDLQLLPPDKKREADHNIVLTHVETLTLLTTTKEGRDFMREVKVYPIIRETHLRVEHDGVKDACERLVQVLMRDEAEEAEELDDDDRIVEIE